MAERSGFEPPVPVIRAKVARFVPISVAPSGQDGAAEADRRTCVWRIADLCRKSVIRHTQFFRFSG